MINTNKIINNIIGETIKVRRKVKPVRRRMRQITKLDTNENYFIVITKSNIKDLMVGLWGYDSVKEFESEHGDDSYGSLFGIDDEMINSNSEIVLKYRNDLLTEKQAKRTGKLVLLLFGDPAGDSLYPLTVSQFIKEVR